RVGRTASGHRGPAALFDERALLPRTDLFQLDEICAGIRLLPELVDANGYQGRDDRLLGTLLGLQLCGRAGHPAAPGEADDGESECPAGCAPATRFQIRWNLHDVRLFSGEGKRRLLTPVARGRSRTHRASGLLVAQMRISFHSGSRSRGRVIERDGTCGSRNQ